MTNPTPFRDKSGFAAFSNGEYGAMHVMAHEMLDQGDFERGHAALGAYLQGRLGAGSAFLHLHWHMLVFEIELGHFEAAKRRFLDILLPAGLASDDARTDVPSAMWRLALAAPVAVELPWTEVAEASFARTERRHTAQTALYDLLLLGGAKDIAALEAFIGRVDRVYGEWDGGLDHLAAALRELALGRQARAAQLLHRAGAALAGLIGSAAQAELLGKIAGRARARTLATGRTTLVIAA